MKAYIKMNLEHGYSEDEICEKFDISHMRYRREHPAPHPKLSDDCMDEIYTSKTRDTAKQAKRYKCSPGQILRAFRQQPNAYIEIDYTEIEQRALVMQTPEDIADALNIPISQVKKHLKTEKSSHGPAVRELLASGHTQQETADELGISQPAVAYHAETKIPKKRGPGLTYDKWRELIDMYNDNKATVSELSRKFGISRPAIYQRLKRDGYIN